MRQADIICYLSFQFICLIMSYKTKYNNNGTRAVCLCVAFYCRILHTIHILSFCFFLIFNHSLNAIR